MQMSPMKHRFASQPIPVETRSQRAPTLASVDTKCGPCTLPGTLANALDSKAVKSYPVLPHDLASDIQQFVESDFAKRYFSTHRRGFIFRRRVPVSQMMTWQKVRPRSVLVAATATESPSGTATVDFAVTDAQPHRQQGGGESVQGRAADHGRSRAGTTDRRDFAQGGVADGVGGERVDGLVEL